MAAGFDTPTADAGVRTLPSRPRGSRWRRCRPASTARSSRPGWVAAGSEIELSNQNGDFRPFLPVAAPGGGWRGRIRHRRGPIRLASAGHEGAKGGGGDGRRRAAKGGGSPRA